MKKNKKGMRLLISKIETNQLLIYTLLFALLFYACFGVWFQKYGKTFFRTCDGLDQHYLIFVYIGKWMRQIIRGILIDHKLTIPMWNMGIGYGADILTSTGAYLPDPFNWLSVIIPTRFAETGYAIVIILKIYLSGLAFIFFCHYKKIEFFPALIGSLIYTFSGTMYVIFVESFFANPLYIFPFILVGADRLWKEKGSKLYVFSLAFMFANYFYFAYMTTLLIIGYCLLRLYYERKEFDLRKTGCLVMRFLYNSLFSAGMAMIVLLPIILVMQSVDRLGVKYYCPILYPEQYYSSFISGFFSFLNMSHRDAYIGFGLISFFCIMILFIKRKNPLLRTVFIIMTIGLCIPAFGVVMNGFSYYANRWCWAYALCVAYIVSTTVMDIPKLERGEKKLVTICAAAYIGIVVLVLRERSETFMVISLILIISLLVIWLLPSHNIKFSKCALITLTMISVIVPAYYVFYQEKINFLGAWTDKDTAYGLIADSGGLNYLEELGADGSQRYDIDGVPAVRNASWIYGISGMDFYISLYNNNIDVFHNGVAMLTSPWTNGYKGLNGRSELEYLMNVDYYVTAKDADILPYAYESASAYNEDINCSIHKSTINNSYIHGFDQVVERKKIEKYRPYYRQQILMQMPYVEAVKDTDAKGLPEIMPDEIDVKSIVFSDNMMADNNNIDINDGTGTVSISFDDIRDAEIYVYLEGIDYYNGEDSDYSITIKMLNKGNEINSEVLSLLNNKNHMYGGKHNWLVNLGIAESDTDQIVLEFDNAGHYTLNDICVYAKPLSGIKNNINNIPNIAKNVIVDKNLIEYDIIDSSYRYMMISIPYSSGWKAYVDGKARDIRVCDDAFMLLDLKDGDKHVKLKYMTPGLLPGLVITAVSICLYCYIERQKRLKTKQENL